MKKAGVKPDSSTFVWLFLACSKAPTHTGGVFVPRCYYLFDEMVKFGYKPTVQHFNFALQTCANCSDGQRTQDILEIMNQQGVSPDLSSLTAMIRCHANDLVKLFDVWQQLRTQFAPDVRAYNTLLVALKNSPNPFLCLKILRQMPQSKVVRWRVANLGRAKELNIHTDARCPLLLHLLGSSDEGEAILRGGCLV